MVFWGFSLFAPLLAAAIVAAWPGRRPALALGLAGWLAATAALAASGRLADFSSFPPLLLRLVLLANLVGLGLAFSGPVRWSLAALVAFQGFRLPLELLMHRAATEGLMPGQMSYSGSNFDIVTGASGLLLGWLLQRGLVGPPVALAWNLLGLGLLANVVRIAVLSFPGPLQTMWPSNLWVTDAPYVWLPTLMVPVAFTGHLLVFRKLWETAGRPEGLSQTAAEGQ